MLQGVGDQVLDGHDRLLLGQFHGARRDDGSRGQLRVSHVTGERILHQQLLQLQVGLGDDQVLLPGSDGGLSARDLYGSQGPDLDLLLVVRERFLSEGQ